MPRTSAKVAISLDPTLLEAIDGVQRVTGESRSAVIARAIRKLVDAEARQRRILDYVESYRRSPEGDTEVGTARALARRSLAHVAWDE